MIERDVAWSPVEGHGLEVAGIYYNEHLSLIEVYGDILGIENDNPFLARYNILCYPNWGIKEVVVNQQGNGNESGGSTILLRTEAGKWTNNHGTQSYNHLKDCTDIDISFTPIAKTLIIRRLNLEVGEARDINVLYFEAPLLQPRPTRQRYTCLEKHDDGAIYRLNWAEKNVSVDIPVDTDGLVLDYPELFKRVWSKR